MTMPPITTTTTPITTTPITTTDTTKVQTPGQQPGLTNQFQQQLTDWSTKSDTYKKKVGDLTTQYNTVQKQITDLENVNSQFNTPGSGNIPGAGGLYIGNVMPIDYGSINTLRSSLINIGNQIAINNVYYKVYNDYLEGAIYGNYTSFDEFYSASKVDSSGISDVDIKSIKQSMQEVWDNVGSIKNPSVVGTTEKPTNGLGATIPELVPPTNQPSKSGLMVGMTGLTVASLTKNLELINLSNDQVPETQISSEDYLTFLKNNDIVGADATQVQALQVEARDIMSQAGEELVSQGTSLKQLRELPRAGVWETAKQIMLSPLQPFFTVIQWEQENTGDVVSAWLIKQEYYHSVKQKVSYDTNNQPNLSKLSDAEVIDYYFSVGYEEALKSGSSEFNALKAGYQYTANNSPVTFMRGVLKGFVSQVFNPINYVGLGIGKALETVPWVGRIAKYTISPIDSAFLTVGNAPFDAVKILYGRIPKSVTNLASMAGNSAVRLAYRALTGETKKTLFTMTMEQATPAIERSINAALVNPESGARQIVLGKLFLTHAPMTEKEVLELASKLGSKFSLKDITPKVLSDINEVFEDMFLNSGKDVKLVTPEATAKLIFKIIPDIADTPVNTDLAIKLLSAKVDKIVSTAMDFAKLKNPYTVLRKLQSNTSDIYLKASESAMQTERRFVSNSRALLYNTSDKVLSIWRNSFDKLLNKTFAEAYLAFALYGPMNVLEDYMRSVLGHVRPGSLSAIDAQNVFHNLLADPDLTLSGTIIEMTGGEAVRGKVNPLIKYSLGLGQEKFASSIYDALITNYGRISMGIRRNFVGEKYLQILVSDKFGGNTLQEILDLATKQALPTGIDKSVENTLLSSTKKALSTCNPDVVRGLSKQFTNRKLTEREVGKLISKYPDLPPQVRNLLLDANEVGLLFENGVASIDGYHKKLIEEIYKDAMNQPEVATLKFKGLTDKLDNFEVTNPEEAASLLNATKTMSEIFNYTPRKTLAVATEVSRGMKLAERSNYIRTQMDKIDRYISEAGISMDKILDKVNKIFSAPEKINHVDWTSVLAQSKLPGMGADEIKSFTGLIDKLPGDVKSTLKSVNFDPNLKSPATYLDGVLTYRSKADMTAEVTSHEVSHMYQESMVANHNMEPLVQYATVYSKPMASDVVRTSPLGYQELQSKLEKDAVNHPDLFQFATNSDGKPTGLFETFSMDFERWCNSPNLLSDNLKEFFHKYFPKNQGSYGPAPFYAHDLLDILTVKKELSNQFMDKNLAWRREFFAGQTSESMKLSSTWDEFSSINRSQIDAYNLEDAKLNGQIAGLIQNPRAGNTTARTPLDFTNKVLSPQDLVAITGSKTSEITRALLDNMCIQQDREQFKAYIMGVVNATGDKGITPEAVGQVYDQLLAGLGIDPDKITSVTKMKIQAQGLTDDLKLQYSSKQFSPTVVNSIKDYINGVADKMEKRVYTKGAGGKRIFQSEFKNVNQIRQEAMDEAHREYYREYTDYSQANMVDGIMKSIFPYWTYESQRWMWVPRSFIQHPALLSGFNEYSQATDNGYVHIPGTDISLNPFRGTIYGMVSSNANSTPQLYKSGNGFLGELAGFSSFLSNYGFYPGAAFSIPLSLFGGSNQKFGETIPASWSTPLDLMVAAFPSNKNVKSITDGLFHDRFRDYMTVLEVTAAGYDGTLIWSKLQAKEKLSEEEQTAWDNSRRLASLYGALFEQTGIFKLKPNEQVIVSQAASLVIQDMTGFTPEQQVDAKNRGIDIWNLVGGMSPAQVLQLKELGYYNWIGLARPVLPQEQQDVLNRLELDWNKVEVYTTNMKSSIVDLQQSFLSGEISPSSYRDQLQGLYAGKSTYIDQLEVEDPLMTLQGRKDYYVKNGTPVPVMHPLKELINLYFSIPLNDKTDPITGEVSKDWDTFFAMRQTLTDCIPPQYQQEFNDYLTKNSGRLELIQQQVSNKYLRKYNQLFDEVMKAYTPQEQSMIKEYYSLKNTRSNLERQTELGLVKTVSGRQLVDEFSAKVSEEKQALRYANPFLDAWLYYFGYTSTFINTSSERAYQQICLETGRKY